MPAIRIYTDGACSGNPGPGGWGAVLKYKGRKKVISGFHHKTTNNIMELRAVIEAVKAIKEPEKWDIEIYTDSKYVKDGFTLWMQKWIVNSWKLANNKPVKNADMWKELHLISKANPIKIIWVKGHSGHPENEEADLIARNAIKKEVF